MSASPETMSKSSDLPAKGGPMGFIKRNTWVVLVGVFAVLIIVGIVAS